MTSILDRLVRIADGFMNAVRVLVAVLLIASVLLNFANVFGRKFLHAPIVGAEEVMTFLMIALVFFGAGVVAYDGTHINMEIVIDRFSPRLRYACMAITQLASIAVAAIIIRLGIPVIQHLAQFDERSQAANVPLFIPQAAVPLGFALLALGALTRLIALRPRPTVPLAADHPGA